MADTQGGDAVALRPVGNVATALVAGPLLVGLGRVPPRRVGVTWDETR